MAPSHPNGREWWKEAIVYQIYPASFLDSNGDGLGDLPGIVSKLDHIHSVGANAIWLSPIFKSPQKDMGYDVADYRDIHQPYGSLRDMETLISGCHERDIKVLLDLVVNHTSDQHEWFQESRSTRSSPKRDWYIWRDPKISADGERKPPNNWASIFGGSAWTWDEQTGQYYLSLFLPSQPDLNWTNEDMRYATHADMEFWLQKGIDGFRIDSMNLMSKHPDLPDAEIVNPDAEFQSGDKYFASGPRMHEYIQEIRKVLDRYDAMTVGELGFTKDEASVSQYVARDRHELNMVFTGDIVDMDFGPEGKYQRNDFEVSRIRDITTRWQTAMPKFDGWNAVYLDNHDSGRSLTRYASDLPQHREAAAKMLAIYMATLSGTLFLLQGQEIGMANAPDDWTIEEYIDVEGSNYYKSVARQRGEGADMKDILGQMRLKARDNGRLPMQWSSEANGGFTKAAKPWMRVNDDFREWNVESQENKDDSVLAHWREMLALRKKEKEVFVYGQYEVMDVEKSGENIFAYTMSAVDGTKKALVVLNFSGEQQEFGTSGFEHWRRLVGGHTGSELKDSCIQVAPYEGNIFCNW